MSILTLPMYHAPELQWRIARTEAETDRVTNLYLEPLAERPSFIAGQYLTIKLPNIGPAEGKAYSISSAPHEADVRVSIKRMGKFSYAILAHKIGDTLTTSLPYGFFCVEPDETFPLVFVVGGIGITPCMSILKDLLQHGDTRDIFIHYANQTEAGIAFYTELQDIVSQHANVHIRYYLTRDPEGDKATTHRRFTAEDITSDVPVGHDATYFICGAMDLTKSLWRDLRKVGVPQSRLYTEGFF